MAAFASARVDAWHQLGTVTRECMTAGDVMETAYLGGWNVRKIAVQGTEFTPDGVNVIDAPDRFMTVRTSPFTGTTEYLGVVGNDYTPVQNEEACELLDLLTDESGAHFETAGSLCGGRRVFVTMKLPDTMRVGGVDDIDLYLAASNGHDGTAAMRVDVTPVRVVCANTQRAAFRHSRGHYSFRHTSGAKNRIEEARQALRLTWRYCEAFEAEAERMINEILRPGEFDRIVSDLWPLPPNPGTRAKNNHLHRQGTLRFLLEAADTQRAIRGTRWAGYQAITEYLDHKAPAKNEDMRANRVLTSGALADIKTRAFDLLSVG
jgi:phage/plasmid-like protein (TIGR03299 family)